MVALPLLILLGLPLLFIKIKMVGSPIIILFTNLIIPMILASWILLGGIYD